MVHNLAGNTYRGKKWWLLKHGRLVQIGCILLAIFLPVIFLFAIEYSFSFSHEMIFNFMFLLFVIFWVIIWIYFSGSAYSRLHDIINELDSGWVIEDFDPLRYKVTVREGDRQYVILYPAYVSYIISLILLWDQLPDHYQVWTHYGGGSVQRNRYDLAKYVRASGGENIFDENLMETVPHLHEEAKQISSLRFVGYAREGVEIVLAAFLAEEGCKEVIQVLNLLKKITQGTGEYHPFDE